MGLYDFTIYDFIRRNAMIYTHRECLVFQNTRLTHGQFKERCDQVAAGLKKAGIQKGDRLGVISQNCLEFMILIGAAAKMGAIVLPVNWRFQKEEVEFVLNDCTPKFVFAGPEYRPMISEAKPRIPSITRCYTLGGGERTEGFFPFEDLYVREGSEEEIDIPSHSGLVIIHTAAVAGRPRGALLSHGNMIAANLGYMYRFGLGTQDCFLCFLPLYHAAGLCTTLAVMHAGGKNVIVERFDAQAILQLIEKEKGTLFFNFAPILKMILDKYEEGSYDLSSLRTVTGLDTPETITRFKKLVPHATYWTGFGQTECMGVSSAPYDEKPGSAGKPSPLCRVALFDDYDQEVPVGTPGEICVRSPMVFLGYWGREEDNAYTFRNGWHHTGDMGRFDEEGNLWYVKRKAEKELIKPGGENVYPAEVEKAILDHPEVAEVSVIGVRDPEWGEAIKAVCVLKKGSSLTAQALIDFVASRIARYKKPKYVEFVPSLPKDEQRKNNPEKQKADNRDKKEAREG